MRVIPRPYSAIRRDSRRDGEWPDARRDRRITRKAAAGSNAPQCVGDRPRRSRCNRCRAAGRLGTGPIALAWVCRGSAGSRVGARPGECYFLTQRDGAGAGRDRDRRRGRRRRSSAASPARVEEAKSKSKNNRQRECLHDFPHSRPSVGTAMRFRGVGAATGLFALRGAPYPKRLHPKACAPSSSSGRT